MFQWFKEPKIDFMRPRRLFLALSTAACLAGIFSCLQLYKGKANLGTDFGSGVMLRLSAPQEVPVDRIRESLKTEGYPDSLIQQVHEPGDKAFRYLIKIKYEAQKGVGTMGGEVLDWFNKNYPEAKFTLEGSDEVGPAVSKKLRDVALTAFLLSMLGILVYIAFRFDFRFGVAAVLTTIHDILVILACIILSGMEFNLLQVTALLTLVGYSLNDTVVTFDRIRENLKLLVKHQDYTGLVNLSVNETLSRTINTSITVALTLLPLCMLGGEVLKEFAVTLLLGVVVGTYSSIFVACPIIVEWDLLSRKGKNPS